MLLNSYAVLSKATNFYENCAANITYLWHTL